MRFYIPEFKHITLFLLLCSIFPATAAASPIDELTEKLTSTLEGKIVKVKGGTYYIGLGSANGAVEGAEFEIAREGEPIKVDGKVLGYEEDIIGLLKLERVRKQLSQGKIIGESSQPAKVGDKVYQKRKQLKRLVIAPFSFNQNTTEYSKTVQEKLITTLVQKGVQVVERSQLDQVLKEQKLTYSGLFDLKSAKQIGKLLGAEGILLGTISDLGNTVSINARIVDLGSANSVSAAVVETAKNPTIVAQLGQTLQDGGSSYSSGSASSSSGGGAKKGQTLKLGDTKIELVECVRTGGVECSLFITNTGKEAPITIYAAWSGKYTKAHDNLRNSYTLSQVKMADGKPGRYANYNLDRDIPIRGKITFKDVDSKANKFVLLRMDVHHNGHKTFKFKNIKIK